MKRRFGFTLIELLVVIAIIAVLMGILMPALRRVREQARQRSCASRVRQHLLAMQMYADDYNGKFPMPRNGGYWLWDLNVNTVNFMVKTGLTPEIFYCPSNDSQQKYQDMYWQYTNTWDGKKFEVENNDDNGYVVSGYCYLLQIDPSANAERPEIRDYEKRTPGPKEWVSTNREKRQSEKELVIDSTLGEKDNDAKYRYNFGMVTNGGMWSMHQVPDRTSHLKNDEEPQGGNIGYLDSHVGWRAFSDMEERFGGANDTPAFFW